MEKDITGIMVYYYEVCKRKLWYYYHNINMEQNNENVAIGKFIDENSYSRDEKHINIDNVINIDFIKEKGILHEVKKSKKIEEASILQVKYYLYYLSKRDVNVKAKIDYPLLKKNIILPTIALGLSPFIMQFTESVLAVSFNTSLLKYGGDLAVGSMTILNSVNQFCMMPLSGLSQGAQPIVSFNYGAKNVDRVQKAFKLLLRVCVVYSVVLWSISMFLPKAFILIFTSDSELIKYTMWSIRIYMAGSCVFGIQLACQQTFIALGNAKKSIFLALLRKCILLIPLIYIFPLFIVIKLLQYSLQNRLQMFLQLCVQLLCFILNIENWD